MRRTTKYSTVTTTGTNVNIISASHGSARNASALPPSTRMGILMTPCISILAHSSRSQISFVLLVMSAPVPQ